MMPPIRRLENWRFSHYCCVPCINERQDGMERYPGLDLTESFLAAAEELNFRRTAERLGIDQSALSRRIRKLEETVGIMLFERTTREVSLTPAGRSFYEASKALVQGYDLSLQAARRIAEGKSGQLRVGYMAFAAVDVMPRVIARFRMANPEVDVSPLYMRTQGQKLALASGELDLGFLIGPFDHSEFQTVRLASDRLHVFMRKDHPLAARAAISPRELAGEDLLLGDMAEWEAYRWRLSEMFSAAGVALRVRQEASSTLALLGLVAAGLGVTIYPAPLSRLLAHGLESRPITDPVFRIETVLAWRRLNRVASLRHFVADAEYVAASLQESH